MTQKFKTVASDKLFYDRWQYCIHFRLDELSCLRDLDHQVIDRRLVQQQIWRENIRRRWPQNNFVRTHKDITDITSKNLHQLCDLFLALPNDSFKMVITVDWGRVYSNDLTLINSIGNLHYLSSIRYTQAKITRAKNTISQVAPKYSHRSYFKNTKLSVNEKESLEKFLTNQQIKISPALTEWFKQPYIRTYDYFFIDHNDIQWLTMLALVQPGLIRKTLPIVAK